MGFSLYPDPPVPPVPLVVGANGGQVDSVLTQRAGAPRPDLTGIYAQMMFMRVAMKVGAVAPKFPHNGFGACGRGDHRADVAVSRDLRRERRCRLRR